VTRYDHTQIGYLTICVLFTAAILVGVTGIVASAGRDNLLIRATVEVILLISAIVFSRLTIKIEGETLQACFAVGLICKKVPLREIVACEAIRIRWWYGWGIHLTPYDWLYNVSGLDAVAITLRNGRKIRVGYRRSARAGGCNQAFDRAHVVRLIRVAHKDGGRSSATPNERLLTSHRSRARGARPSICPL
jgi:hypothetical protein